MVNIKKQVNDSCVKNSGGQINAITSIINIRK